MKKLLASISILGFIACNNSPNKASNIKESVPSPSELVAGKTYTRILTSDIITTSGTPVAFLHTIKFIDNENVVDNHSSFFGHPPSTGKYKVDMGLHTTITINIGGVEEYYALSTDLKTLTKQDNSFSLTLKEEPSVNSDLNAWELPELSDVTIHRNSVDCKPGDLCPAVEPSTNINFNYASCAKREFELTITDKTVGDKNIKEIRVIDKHDVDCMGDSVVRNYDLIIENLVNRFTRYVLINAMSNN